MTLLQNLFLVVCLASSVITAVSATVASERESESVEVTFYMLSESEWNDVSTAFKTLVAAEAATYCTNNAAECGLDSGFLFLDSDVGVYSGPTEESKSLKIKFYIDFPIIHVVASNSSTTYVINSATVTTILKNIRDSLETAVGHDITYIGDEYYSIDPDALANKVIIPIAIIVLIAMIILTIALHMWSKRKEMEEKKRQRALEREKRKNRVTPVCIVENDKKPSSFFPRRSRKKKTNNGNIPTLSLKTNMMTYGSKQGSMGAASVPEKPPVYDDPAQPRNNTLPPLPNPADEEAKAEKKEKRRRRRQKRRQEDGREESETEVSKTESLEVSQDNVIAVEDDEAGPNV